MSPGAGRRFGFLMSLAFVVLALAPVVAGGDARLAWLLPAGSFAAVALAWPRALLPLRRWWLALGRLLGRVTTPIVLRLLYYGVITPYAWLSRRRSPARDAPSYWVDADPPSPLDRPF